MIIDISYIKSALNVDIEDDAISFLIQHYFNDICNYVDVNTTLENEDIVLNVAIEPVIADLINDDLTLFQETLIFGIGCHLSNMKISIPTISNELYNKIINTLIDISKLLPADDGKYQITYCDVYNDYKEQLKQFVDQVDSVSYLRRLLNVDSEFLSDNELKFLSDYYKKYLIETIPDVDTTTFRFKQAVYYSVACHIYKTNPTIIISPSSYQVDETSEYFNLNFYKDGSTWCNLADDIISLLKKETYGYYGIKVFDRPGARTKYNNYGPTG